MFELFYVWGCIIFSVIYVQRRVKRGELAWWNGKQNPPWQFYLVGFTVLLSWWYWPVMIYHLVKETKEERDRADMEYRNRVTKGEQK